MVYFNSSIVTQPFNVSVVTNNGTDELRRLVAPAWVSNPGVRGTLNILQSCILTLVACIYTALHLDVPSKTTWHHLLWQKTKWVLITLFAPELAVFVAASQLRYAWNLRSELRKIQKEKQAFHWKRDADFEINLKYAFCIVMGAVRFDVHDILSLNDLNESDREYFKDIRLRRRSVRPGPAAIIQLAKRGHWIQIPKQDVDDKSKADTIQKTLVVIQVLWMVTQCIARRIYNLPLSVLEIHTIVHVVCAVFLYACWFKKPLNIQEAMVVQTKDSEGQLAVMLQRQFYSEISYKMALFPSKEEGDATPPIDVDGSPMQWIESHSGTMMCEGNILPSGLALSRFKMKEFWPSQSDYSEPDGLRTTESFGLELSFLARWDAILTTFPFEEQERLAQGLKATMLQHVPGCIQHSSTVQKVLFLPLLQEFEPKLCSDWESLFWEGGSFVPLNFEDSTDMVYTKTGKESMTKSDMTILSLRFLILATVLPGLYGGVHLIIWGQSFPSYAEELMWKVSCLIIICGIPSFVTLSFLLFNFGSVLNCLTGDFIDDDVFIYVFMGSVFLIGLGYIAARVFIIVESFLSLRKSPVGVFLSPGWIELFPISSSLSIYSNSLGRVSHFGLWSQLLQSELNVFGPWL